MSPDGGWLILKYMVFGVIGTLGLLFCGILAAAYVSGMARDRNRDRNREVAALFERDIEH
jgi:hypothetical protein